MRKRHINEFKKTAFANSGRAAGMGILEDNYSGNDELRYRGKLSSSFDHQEKIEHGEVIVYAENNKS